MDTEISKFDETLEDNRDAISPIFKFSVTVRKVIYTANARITEFDLPKA